jgi:hypothetical protein
MHTSGEGGGGCGGGRQGCSADSEIAGKRRATACEREERGRASKRTRHERTDEGIAEEEEGVWEVINTKGKEERGRVQISWLADRESGAVGKPARTGQGRKTRKTQQE